VIATSPAYHDHPPQRPLQNLRDTTSVIRRPSISDSVASDSEQSFPGFQEMFADDRICADHLLKMRWPRGFVCPRCGDQGWRLTTRPDTYQCRSCAHQTSLKAGTVMQGSRLPLKVWFWGAHLLATSAESVPVRRFQRLLGISYKAAPTQADISDLEGGNRIRGGDRKYRRARDLLDPQTQNLLLRPRHQRADGQYCCRKYAAEPADRGTTSTSLTESQNTNRVFEIYSSLKMS
jgi:hypothetical protein